MTSGYTVGQEERSILGKDRPYCCNRPIFCANSNCTLLAGDRPLLRLVKSRFLLGSLQMGIRTEEGVLYLQNFSSIEFRYQANLAVWDLSDPKTEGIVHVCAGSPEGTQGYLVKVSASSPVELCWQYGGIYQIPGDWNISPMINKELLQPVWDGGVCHGNQIQKEGALWTVNLGEAEAPTVYLSASMGISETDGLPSVTGKAKA